MSRNLSTIGILLLVGMLVAGNLFLALAAGFFGTVRGKKGPWKKQYQDMAVQADAWKNQSSEMKASRDGWEARFWETNGSLAYLQQAYQQLSQSYRDAAEEKDRWEASYYEETKALLLALQDNSQLDDKLDTALADMTKWQSEYRTMKTNRDDWESQYWSTKQALNQLQTRYDTKLDELNTMTKDRDRWTTMYAEMKESRDDWESSYWSMKGQYTQLSASYLALNASWSALDRTHTRLLQQYSELESSYGDLEDLYERLAADYNNMLSEYSALQEQFYQLDVEYTWLKEDYDALEEKWDAYIDWYKTRTGWGDYAMRMITPNDATVSAKSSQVLGWSANGDLTWSDMNTLHSWVGDNIAYKHDPPIWNPYSGTEFPEYWQSPSRTLSEKIGDCEDQANLLLSLFLAEDDVGWAYAALIHFASGGAHVVIFINVEGDQMFIYDPTWNSYWFFGLLEKGGWKSNGSGPERAKIAEYEQKAGTSIQLIAAVYNDKVYKAFTSMQEFYDWF